MVKYMDYIDLEVCEICGAALGPCYDWPWHYDDEDCRAVRKTQIELAQE